MTSDEIVTCRAGMQQHRFRPGSGVSLHWSAAATVAPTRQQIRHATGQDTDPGPRFLSVVLDTFMRALPHTLREVTAPVGTQIQMRINGPADGTWTVTATGDRWSLAEPDKPCQICNPQTGLQAPQ